MLSPSLALLLSIFLSSAAKIGEDIGKPQTGHTANDTAQLASLLSLARGSSADSTDVDIQWTQHDV